MQPLIHPRDARLRVANILTARILNACLYASILCACLASACHSPPPKENIELIRIVIVNNVKIQNNVSVYDNVTLEDDVFCGPSMVFTNVYNPRSAVNRKDEYRDTLVKRGATLGANCTIVCGITVGQHAFVGAGAVVRDVKHFALMAGA